MKKTLTILSAMAIVMLMSCNNDSEKKTEEATATIPSASFQVMVVRLPVLDYSKFYSVYNGGDSLRNAFGISKYHLAREMADSNKVIVLEKIETVQKAQDFSNSPVLKDAMGKGGVAGAPSFDFINVIRNDDSKIDYADRIMMKHHVKDFAAWLKVYDGEGMKTRADYGMIDRGLGRGALDSNMVYIVFAISDMAKAKARGESEELKKIMTDAGVDGPPETIMYKIVE